MRPVTKKIVEAGLVDKHTARLMEKWGVLESGDSDSVGLKKLSVDTLVEFADDIEELLDAERATIRETKLNIQVGEPFLVDYRPEGATAAGRLVVYLDADWNYIFPSGMWSRLQVSTTFRVVSDDTTWEIEEITPFYINEHIYAMQVVAKKV